MIVYGERTVARAPAALVESLRDELATFSQVAPALDRHGKLVSMLLGAGALVQGLADRAFHERGRDEPDPAAEAAMALALVLARQVWRSFRSCYQTGANPEAALAALQTLAPLLPGDALTVKSPEGFKHYAVYPEVYATAAWTLNPRARPLVVGLRTIGATLAATVAAARGHRELPLTVRPVGPPFERRLSLGGAFTDALAAARLRGLAIVDEGPGLSGSSFGAVLDAAEAAGVPGARIHVFPGHLHVGPHAHARTRARWERIARHSMPFEAVCLGVGRTGLGGWTADLTGPQDGPPQDLGAGLWRSHVFTATERWPGVCKSRERRKYLLRARGRPFLARFAGLGADGAATHARAATLARAGFTPPVLGLRHGFLVHPWLEEVRPLTEARALVPRAALLQRLGDYLAFRAGALPAPAARGATPRALLDMATTNVGETLGPERAARLRRFEPWLDELARVARPMEIDGRLHAWEWLVLPGGQLLKADAVDHCDAHDPIGCQDIAWDVAGASVELALATSEVAALSRRVGLRVEPERLAFYRTAYLAFQLGLCVQAESTEPDPADALRLRRTAGRYAELLCQGP